MAIDYKSFGPNGPEAGNAVLDRRWWLSNKSDIAGAVESVVTAMANNDSRRQTQYQLSTKLYGNLSLMGLSGMSYSKMNPSQSGIKDRITYNICQATTDTITSKIAKNKPDPLFLTSGGDYKIQRRAKKLDKFVDGIFYENDAYSMGPDAFRDGCIFGDGFTHVFARNGRVAHERVLPSELYVDQFESFYGHPRQLHRVKNVDRAVLIDMFPEKKRAIKDAPRAMLDFGGNSNLIADQVTVCESWRLPSGKESNDGLHTIIIPGQLLEVSEYKKPFFPFARFQWNKRVVGYYGQGLVEQVQNIQLEINKLLWVIQRSMHMAGTFKIFMENGSKIVKEHFTNDIGLIMTYTNTKPEYVVPPVVPMEYYAHFERLKAAGFEQCGISMLSATSQKPAGLNSGKALREYNDIETERFMVIGQQYERYFMSLAKLTVSVAQDIYENQGSYESRVPGKRFVETIDWKDVDLTEDQYVMKVYPVSALPSEPAGKLQTIQEYAQAGYMAPRTARKLLDFPDVEQVEDLANAMEDHLTSVFDKIVDDGIFTAPEPFDDLKLAREMALEHYAKGKCNGLEEEKLELFRRFISQIDVLEAKALPPPMPGGQVIPMGNPQPTPTSELIPNVNQSAAA